MAQAHLTASRRIVTLYWENIDRNMVKTQADVFRHLGYEIEQTCATGLDHGVFLDRIMSGLGDDETMLCVDIDCFPTNSAIVENAFAAAEAGRLIGCAQVSTHIDPNRIFTAPMFLAISKRLWTHLGCPSFCTTATGDIAQGVHDRAVAAGIGIDYLTPWACLIPKWSLAGQALYGVGTFYKGGVFHLFQSRTWPFTFAFSAVAADVLANRETDVLALSQRAMRLYVFAHVLTRWTRFWKLNRLHRWKLALQRRFQPDSKR